MSLVALKRKYEAIKKNKGINGARVTPSSYLATQSMINKRTENKTYFITPDINSSEYTQKIKSDTLYREDNCQSSSSSCNNQVSPSCANRKPGAPINIKKKICNVHCDMNIDTHSDYIETVKQGCTRNETLPRIPNMETKC